MANTRIGVDIDAKINKSINSQIDALEKKFAEMQSIGNKSGFGEKIRSEIQAAKDEVSQLREEFNDIYSGFKNQKLDTKQFDNFVKSIESSIDEMKTRISEAEGSIKKLEVAFKAGRNSSIFEKRLDSLQNKINEFVSKTQEGISALIDFNKLTSGGADIKIKGDTSDLKENVEQTVSSFTFKDGGVKIPVTLDTKQIPKLKAKYDEIVGMLQSYANTNPVDVTMRLFPLNTNKAGAKEVTDAVKNVQAQIANLPEGDLKSSMNTLYADLEKQYQKALRLKIDVDLGETQASIKQRIKELNDTVKEQGFTIYPDFKIDDATAEKISNKLSDIQKKLTLNVTSELKSMSDSLRSLFNSSDVKTWSKTFISSLDAIQIKLDSVIPLVNQLKVGTKSENNTNLKKNVPNENDVNILVEFTNAMKALRESLQAQQTTKIDLDIQPIIDKLETLQSTIVMVHSGIGNLQAVLSNVKNTGGLQLILETLQKIENVITEINTGESVLNLKANPDIDVVSFINKIQSQILQQSDGVEIPISLLNSSIDDFIQQIQFAIDSRLTNGDIGNESLLPTPDNDLGANKITSLNRKIGNLKEKIESTWESWYDFAKAATSGTNIAGEGLDKLLKKLKELTEALQSVSKEFNIDFSKQLNDIKEIVNKSSSSSESKKSSKNKTNSNKSEQSGQSKRSQQLQLEIKLTNELLQKEKEIVNFKSNGVDSNDNRIQDREKRISEIKQELSLLGDLRKSESEQASFEQATAVKRQALRDSISASEAKLQKEKEKSNQATIKAQEKENRELIKQENELTHYARSWETLNRKISEWRSRNTSAESTFGSDLDDLQEMASLAPPSAEELRNVASSFDEIKRKASDAGKTGSSVLNMIKQRAKSMIATFTTFNSVYDIVRIIKQGFNSIRELDTALVDLRKTTTMSNSELNEFYINSNSVAKQLGVTTAEVINQASAWSRLGYSSKEAATEMSELSSQFASISPGVTVEQGTDYLVSTMKAFEVQTDEVERKILDNVNAIGNAFATTNGEIGEMLTRSSAAMKAANNSLEETIALETAAVEITRNAETTGTAFRTISMRLRGYSEESEDGLEEVDEELKNISGDIADLTKINGKGGISIFTDANKTEYKSTYQILKEISEIWHDLTDAQQAQLLEKLAGKRGGQVLAGILNDFSSVDEALETMEDAAGSADREMEIIRQSWDYKINALKETWVGTLQELVKRKDVGNVIDFLTNVSTGIGNIVSNLGLLKTALIGVVTVIGGKKLGLFNYNKEVGAFEFGTKGKSNPEQNFLKSVVKNGFDKNGNLDADAVLKISDKFEDANVKTKAWVVNLAKGTEQLKEGQTAAEAINEKIVNSGFSFKKLGGSVKGLLGSIGASMLNMGIATAASFAVTGITKLVDKLIVTKKELAEMRKSAIEAGKTAQEEINSTFKALSDNTKTIESIEDRFSELSKGVDEKTGKNLSLTNDEYEEFLGYNQQIIEMFPDVSRIYTENGDAIAQLGDYADTTSEALKSLIEQQRLVANLELQEKLPTIYEGIKSQSDTYSEKIKQYKKDIEDYTDAINNLPDLKDSFNNVTGNGFLTISDTDYNDKLRFGIEKMLKASGIESKNYNWSHNKAAGEYYLNFYSSDAALDEFRQNFDLYSSQVLTIYNQKLGELQNSLSTTNIQSGNNWNGLTSSVISYLTNDNNYIMLSDEMQNYVQMAINNTDWGKLNFDSWEDLTNYIDGTLITLFQGEHGQELADAVSTMSKHEEEYKEGKITYDEYIDYINKYRSALYRYITSEDEKARLSFWDLFSYDDEEAGVERLKNSVSDLPDNWKLSEDEMQIALEIIAELDGKPITWADLKNQIEEKMSDIEVDAKVNVKNSSAVKSLNDLDTDWAGLNTVYSSTVTTAGTAEAKDIESVNSAMGGVSKAGDEEINSLSNAIEAYDTALVESKGDTEEAQKAVNKLTTAYIDQSGVLDDLDESNAQYYIDMLESKGITNAEEVVMSRLSDTAKRTAKNIKELSKVLVNNYDKLKNSTKGSDDYNKSMSEIKDATTNLLSYEQDGEIIMPTLSDEFILQNLEDIKAATEGDIEALNRLRIEAAKEIVADIKINAPSQEIMGIQNEINQLIDSFDIENIEIGANLDDTAMIQGLNNLVKAGYITRDDMNSALASIGVVPEETGYVDIPISTFGSISNAVAASGLKGIAATEAAKGYSKLDSTAKIRVPSFGYKLANKATGSRYGGAKSSSSGGGGGGGGGGGSSSEPTKPKDESEEMFDWVEVAIQRLQEAEQRLSKEVGNTYSLWTKRNENLSKEIQNVTDQINAQRLAAQEYQKYYNSIQVNGGKGLNADDYGENDELVRQHDQALLDEANRLWATGEYQRKVMSGQLSGDDIEKIANHFLSETIKEYQEMYFFYASLSRNG